MAITKIPKESSLKLKFGLGLDGKGNEIIKSKTFTSVKNTSSDEDIHAIAKGIAGLCQNTLIEVSRVDNAALSE